MDKSMAISLDSKIEDLFEEGRFGKFLEYCRMSDIVVLRQIENLDFVMFKSIMNVSEDEKNAVKAHWEKLTSMVPCGNKSNEDCHHSTSPTECDTTMHDNTNLAELYLLRLLIVRIEHCFADRKGAITIDPIRKPVTWRGLSSEESQIIHKYPNLFYKCSARKFLLIKWIVDRIDYLFATSNSSEIEFKNLYYYLSKSFNILSI